MLLLGIALGKMELFRKTLIGCSIMPSRFFTYERKPCFKRNIGAILQYPEEKHIQGALKQHH